MLDVITRNADADFTATVAPLFDENGNALSPDIGRRVVRSDTGATLAVCGPNFKPVQHSDIIDPILDHLSSNGYEIQERSTKTRSGLYDLAGQKGAFINRAFTENGAVMRTDIILGVFIQPTGSAAYLDDGPDTMLFKISAFNSHNGSLAVRAVMSYERLICLNGMTRADFSSNVYGKHTGNFNLDALKRKLENSLHGMTDDADTFGRWAKQKITIQQAELMLQQTVARLPNKNNGTPHFSAPLVDRILGQFKKEDQTAWGLFQAVTHWQSHGEAKKNADPLKTIIGRESRVAAMLKAPAWGELVEA